MKRLITMIFIMLTALFSLTACNKVVDMVQDGLNKDEEKQETPAEAEEEQAGSTDVNEEETPEQNDLNNEVEEETNDVEKEPSEESDKEDEAEDKEADEEEEDIQLGDYDIYLGGEVIEEEDSIIVDGESNLIPGARVIGEVTVGDEEEPDFQMDTSEKVADDGTFEMKLDHPGEEAEEIDVKVTFHFDTEQNDEVIRHYGDRGQKLEGPYIYKHQRELGGRSQTDIYDKAEVSIQFEPDDTLSVRQFKEPKWYDTPDDMEDPRVWLEVDEINDDQEFYYLHGRSNLAEGSKLRAEYGPNRDETHVLPDGSFDFKLDYEYREDTSFVVTFDPSLLQWNLVEEVYGKKGQNLVGDLVETDKYNTDKQYIEKEVDFESQEIEVPDNVELNVDGSEVTMLVPDEVLFDFDKYDLKKSSKKLLKEIGETLEDSFNKEDLEILISGHTDDEGEKEYNLELSEKRAKEVKKYLEKQLTSKDASFKTEGYGEKKPVASNGTDKGQAKNRRVEIQINLK